MLNRKSLIFAALIVASLLLGGCTPSAPSPTTNLETESPNVSLTGTVIQAGTKFSLNQPGKPPVELDSRKITLPNYVGQTVTVTGQYSGTTLFVDKVE